jgi:hypothetical protein
MYTLYSLDTCSLLYYASLAREVRRTGTAVHLEMHLHTLHSTTKF